MKRIPRIYKMGYLWWCGITGDGYKSRGFGGTPLEAWRSWETWSLIDTLPISSLSKRWMP